MMPIATHGSAPLTGPRSTAGGSEGRPSAGRTTSRPCHAARPPVLRQVEHGPAHRVRYPCVMAIAAVRPAAVPDVAEIVRIQSGTWAVAYAELVPAAAIAQLGSTAAHEAWTVAVTAGEGHV